MENMVYDWNLIGESEPLTSKRVLLDDETLRARLGKRGRQEAQRYSWSRVTEAVLDIYTAVLGRGTHE